MNPEGIASSSPGLPSPRGYPDLFSKTKTAKRGLNIVEREFEVQRRLESQGDVQADGVVEGFDGVKNHGMSRGVGRRDEGAEAFGFESGPEGLHGGVVVAVGF